MMRIETRRVCNKVCILIAIIAFTVLTQTTLCTAQSENTTLTEVSGYDFDSGFYNVVKIYETIDGDYRILHETEIPYLNITFTSPTDGFLDVTLEPKTGAVPCIELNTGWDTDGLTYTNLLSVGDTCYLTLSPAMAFSDSNASQIVDGPRIVWEIYEWGNQSGLISYSFTSSDEISFDLVIYPTYPSENDKVSLFTICDAEIKNLIWTITGDSLSWVNETEVLEINNLPAGDYVVSVEGYDELDNLHIAQTSFYVKPRLNVPEVFDIDFFSVNYPELVGSGDLVSVSATIDYSTSDNTLIKCVLSDSSGVIQYEKSYSIYDSGSKLFTYNYNAEQSGSYLYYLTLFYSLKGEWIEVADSAVPLVIQVAEVKTSPSLPGFNVISILAALTIVSLANYRTQKNN